MATTLAFAAITTSLDSRICSGPTSTSRGQLGSGALPGLAIRQWARSQDFTRRRTCYRSLYIANRQVLRHVVDQMALINDLATRRSSPACCWALRVSTPCSRERAFLTCPVPPLRLQRFV